MKAIVPQCLLELGKDDDAHPTHALFAFEAYESADHIKTRKLDHGHVPF
jgi:hypothetical protein